MSNQKIFHSIARKTGFLVTLSLAASMVNAQSGRSDYDTDKDGLIEIRSVEDFLAVPDTLTGVKLYDSTTGCPESGCLGYELVASLDFADRPNLRLPMPFLLDTIFEGNGYAIQNL